MKLSDSPAPYGTPHKPGLNLDFVDNVGSVTALAADINERAMRSVASRARDAADARDLLEHLGLVEPLVPTPAWRRVYKHKKAAP